MAHVDEMLLRFVVETPGRDAAGNKYRKIQSPSLHLRQEKEI